MGKGPSNGADAPHADSWITRYPRGRGRSATIAPRPLVRCLAIVLLALALPTPAHAEPFRIVVMRDEQAVAENYEPLLAYLAGKGIHARLVPAKDYPAAVVMFYSGEGDGMFSGAAVATAFMNKQAATPAVRPVSLQGHSTFSTVVVARMGAPPFTGSADYFDGKTVAVSRLASAGEFYLRSLLGSVHNRAVVLKTATHQEALAAVAAKNADVAIVKDRMWEETSSRYPNLVRVGENRTEYPDRTLILSRRVPEALASKLVSALLALEADQSPAAETVRKGMKIKSFIRTTQQDFATTDALLKKAGVDKSYNF